MEKNEQKTGKILSEEALRKSMQSLTGTPLPADFDEFDAPLREEIVEELHRLLRSGRS